MHSLTTGRIDYRSEANGYQSTVVLLHPSHNGLAGLAGDSRLRSK